MKPQIALLAVALAVTANIAEAQVKKQPKPVQQVPQASAPKTWYLEPETVFGIKLGGLVTELALPTCPPVNRAGFHDIKQVDLCVLPSTYSPDKRADLFGTPELAIQYKASLSYYNGLISALSLDFAQPDFEKMKSILIERYGDPTKIDVVEVTTRAGAKLTSQQIQWTGKKTIIVAIERLGTIDQSCVSFSDLGVTEKKLADQSLGKKSDAAKF